MEQRLRAAAAATTCLNTTAGAKLQRWWTMPQLSKWQWCQQVMGGSRSGTKQRAVCAGDRQAGFGA